MRNIRCESVPVAPLKLIRNHKIMTQDLLAKNSFHRSMITITVMLVAVIEVLDMTIVNVSLPTMMGSLGANSDQITWVLTSYIVSSAIFMPLTGFLVTRLGRKRLLLMNIGGFLLASVLCGLSTSLAEMILFRTLQGVFGAALVPLSQYILRDAYPKEEHGKAMAIWGIGVMAGPVLGPTLGGYITEALNWRWVFYINVPVCILAFFMAISFISETPRKKEYIDWLGMALMASGIACLQIFLDRGNSQDWFDSNSIILLCVIWVSALSYFIYRGLRKSNNIINLRLFADRNFSLSEILITIYTAGLIGAISIQPIMLENIMGFPTAMTGLLMAPRGVASAIGMVCVAKLINLIDSRVIITAGIIVSIIGTYLMTTFSIESSMSYISWVGALQGLGMGLFFVPLATLAFNSLPKTAEAEASGLFSFSRSLGSSIGISLLTTVVSRQTQANWQQLGSHIQQFNPNLRLWLQHQGWTLKQPEAIGTLAHELSRQAGMIAFIDAFWLVAIAFVVMLPLTWGLSKVRNLSHKEFST